MNNNYHTQLDKQSSILNDIAANNQLLQQQIPNYAGTPISSNIPPNLQLDPLLIQQQYYTQTQKPAEVEYPSSFNDEIDFSDEKPSPNKSIKQKNVQSTDNSNKIVAYPPKNILKQSKQSNSLSIFITPILLIILFTLMVNPTTSKVLEKYLPKMDNFKGIIIRGTVLAVLFFIVSTILRYTFNNSSKN